MIHDSPKLIGKLIWYVRIKLSATGLASSAQEVRISKVKIVGKYIRGLKDRKWLFFLSTSSVNFQNRQMANATLAPKEFPSKINWNAWFACVAPSKLNDRWNTKIIFHAVTVFARRSVQIPDCRLGTKFRIFVCYQKCHGRNYISKNSKFSNVRMFHSDTFI